MLLISFLVATLFTLSTAKSLSLESEWASFKKNYYKTYSNAEEELYRQTVFHNNLKLIEQHNEEAAQGIHTYRLGITIENIENISFEYLLNYKPSEKVMKEMARLRGQKYIYTSKPKKEKLPKLLPEVSQRDVSIENTLQQNFVNIGDISLTGNDLSCLIIQPHLPPTSFYLNDNIVNAFLFLFKNQACNAISVLPTYYFTTLETIRNGNIHFVETEQAIRNLCINSSSQHIILPVCFSYHWILCIIHNHENTWAAKYYDPLNSSNNCTSIMNSVHTILKDSPLNILEFPRILCGPIQQNAYDCGMYVCLFVICYFLEIPYNYSSSDVTDARRLLYNCLAQSNILTLINFVKQIC